MGRSDAARAIHSNEVEEVHMDERIARLESDVAHIKTDISDIKTDIRELRGDMKAANEAIGELKLDVTAVRAEMKQEFNAVRAEIAAVRTDSKNASDAIVARMDAKFESMEKTVRLLNTRNIVAMLLIGASILGAVAKMLKLF